MMGLVFSALTQSVRQDMDGMYVPTLREYLTVNGHAEPHAPRER